MSESEPDAIAYMTDVELETFARAVVAERDALAAVVESTRADNEELREHLALAAGGRHVAEMHARNMTEAASDARAELAAERVNVQAVEERHNAMRVALSRLPDFTTEITGWRVVYADAVLAVLEADAALAAAQPTGETP